MLMMYFSRILPYQPICVYCATLVYRNVTITDVSFAILLTYASRFAVQRCAKSPMIGTITVFDPLAAATRI
jgi:hypothetical protein